MFQEAAATKEINASDVLFKRFDRVLMLSNGLGDTWNRTLDAAVDAFFKTAAGRGPCAVTKPHKTAEMLVPGINWLLHHQDVLDLHHRTNWSLEALSAYFNRNEKSAASFRLDEVAGVLQKAVLEGLDLKTLDAVQELALSAAYKYHPDLQAALQAAAMERQLESCFPQPQCSPRSKPRF